jgi:hypothetical protein
MTWHRLDINLAGRSQRDVPGVGQILPLHTRTR